MEEREPNPSEDPREQEHGGAGYPESQPGGDPTGGSQDERDTSDAPSPSSPDEGDAGQATGNPGAAG